MIVLLKTWILPDFHPLWLTITHSCRSVNLIECLHDDYTLYMQVWAMYIFEEMEIFFKVGILIEAVKHSFITWSYHTRILIFICIIIPSSLLYKTGRDGNIFKVVSYSDLGIHPTAMVVGYITFMKGQSGQLTQIQISHTTQPSSLWTSSLTLSLREGVDILGCTV